jgi:hypothetical protein
MMTDAQMLQNLLAAYEIMVDLRPTRVLVEDPLANLKEVIAELRRRLPESTRWDHSESEFSGTDPDR